MEETKTPDYNSFRQYYEKLQYLKKQLTEANQEARKYHTLFRKWRKKEQELRQKLIEGI